MSQRLITNLNHLKSISEQLDTLFGTLELEDLSKKVTLVEDFVYFHLPHVHILNTLVSNGAKASDDFSFFGFNGITFELSCHESTTERSILEVTILPKLTKNEKKAIGKPVLTRLQLHDSYGRFEEVRIIASPLLSYVASQLAELVCEVIREAETWLAKHLHFLARRMTTKFATEFYTELRHLLVTNLKSDTIADYVFLVMVDKNRGTYALDSHAVDAFLERSSNSQEDMRISPYAALAEIFSQEIPFDQMHSRFAIKSNKCIFIDLDLSDYYMKANQLVHAQHDFIGSKDTCVYPLCRSGQTFLLLAYPQSISSQLNPLLDQYKDELTKIYLSHAGLVKRIARKTWAVVKSPDFAKWLRAFTLPDEPA